MSYLISRNYLLLQSHSFLPLLCLFFALCTLGLLPIRFWNLLSGSLSFIFTPVSCICPCCEGFTQAMFYFNSKHSFLTFGSRASFSVVYSGLCGLTILSLVPSSYVLPSNHCKTEGFSFWVVYI